MSRLIDAEAFKKFLQALYKAGAPYDGVIELIESQPTAYDIEKVVEQLEEEREYSYANFNEYVKEVSPCLDAEYDDVFSRGLERAIEIVKQGNGSNDVCEWESDYKLISDKYKRETGCGYTFYDLHHAAPFKYCPYCGKRIKAGGK